MNPIKRIYVPIGNYFRELTLSDVVWNYIVPLATTGIVALILAPKAVVSREPLQNLISYIINLMAILIGFTIMCLTVLTTSSSDNISKTRNLSWREGSGITIFQWVLTQFAFLLLIEFACLCLNVFYEFILSTSLCIGYGNWFLCFNCFLVLVVMSLNASNVARLYQVFWKKEPESEKK